MAIDSRDRRASIILLDTGWARIWPDPDGVIDAEDRQQGGLKFSGIPAGGGGGGIIGESVYIPTFRPRRR